MKNISTRLIAILIISLISYTSFAQDGDVCTLNFDDNILTNGGFELDEVEWNIPPKYASLISSEVYKGNRSIYYYNPNRNTYAPFISQKFEVEPGQTYSFGGWVKAENLDAKDAEQDYYGAMLFLQTFDENEKFVTGSYIITKDIGGFNWKKYSAIYTVPSNAKKMVLGLGLRKGVTGKVWFDEVELRLEKRPVIESFFTYPNYRGLLPDGANESFSSFVRINNPVETIYKAAYTLSTLQGKVLYNKTYKLTSLTGEHKLQFTYPKHLKIGKYVLHMNYYNDSNEIILNQTHNIEVVEKMPSVYIDKEGYTIKNNEKIFPLGFYIKGGNEEDMKRIKEAGYNTILSYDYGYSLNAAEYLDTAYKHGLNVIYSLKDMYEGKTQYIKELNSAASKFINDLKNKPALLAWYTVDELRPEWLPNINVVYDIIKQDDQNHPAFQVHDYDGFSLLEKYYYSTDIIATDPYPVGRANLLLTSIRTEASEKAMHNSRGVWSVLQTMDWAVYYSDRESHSPSLDEIRNQVFQALIAGAKGILLYSYYDLFYESYPRDKKNLGLFHRRWDEVKKLPNEILPLTEVILNGKRYNQLDYIENDSIKICGFEYNDDLILLFANPYYSENEIEITLPKRYTIHDRIQGQINASVVNNKVIFRLPSIGSGMFILRKQF